MPRLPSDVDLSPTDAPGARSPLDHGTTVGAAPRSPDGERSERTAPHLGGRDAPNIALEPNQCCSPVMRLPPEILAHVFELYVVRSRESTPDGLPSQGPFYLAQVCALWKAIAESDPRLWTSIHFYFPESHHSREEDVPRVRPALDLHLRRSGALPISLSFTDDRVYHSDTEDLISLFVDRLRAHAQRWKRISLQLSCGYFPHLFTFTPCHLSSLEHLYISGDVFRPASVALHLDLRSATNLRSFAYSAPAHPVGGGIHLRWESLAEVSFEYSSHSGTSIAISRQFRHLAQCRNITTCSLGIDQTSWGMNSGQPITLPRLQTLRIRRRSPYAQAHGVINSLTLPQLQTLEIDACHLIGWNEHWHDRNFSGLLTRSRCTLLHLSIQDVDFPNDELARCLALSPALTSLRFIPCPRSQDIRSVIHRLDVSRSPTARTERRGRGHAAHVTGPLVPLLREITLATSVMGYLDLMMAMFRSRVGTRAHVAGVTLRRAEVVFFDLWHDYADEDRTRGERHRLRRTEAFRADVAQWASANRDGSGEEGEGEDGLEASVVVDTPYLAGYIDIQ